MPAAILMGLALAAAAPTRIQTHVYGFDRWRLRVAQDPFARTVTCKLHRRDAEVRRGRLVWSLGSRVDTHAAVWRIDGGEPRVQGPRDLPASANLDNPSDGRIVAPVALLDGAHDLAARANPHTRVRTLPLAGLTPALAAAARLNCAPL